ncbi:MAG: hypothetical protein PHF15_08070 [Rhodoferax sp.]|nr:hypothetical protein [Rhodoferax sp.]
MFEMRDFFGPGWRMYYLEQPGSIIPKTFNVQYSWQRSSDEEHQNPSIRCSKLSQ